MSFDLKLENGSIVISGGDLKQVKNLNKLSQDVVKIVVTPLGTNTLNPWYGSSLADRVVGSPITQYLQDQEIFNAISFAVQNLKILQEKQAATGQYLSPGEQIAAITGIKIERSAQDARQVNIFVGIQTRNGEILDESLTVQL